MKTLSYGIAALAIASLLSGAAFAQSPAPSTTPTPMTKPAAAAKNAEVPHTAASLECSKQADAKGLHGKERKKFRSECRRNAEKPN
jgi:CelD/BcsL family acetyltransferase involved in cellulose biosynthesis